MPNFRTSRRVRHTASDMFDLVADVEQYPSFVPLCQSLKVRRRSALENGQEQLTADMRIGYKSIRETFTSRVTLDRAAMTILVEYVDGPFRQMENRWTFVPAPDSADETLVEFYIDYEFKSRMLGLLMGTMFEQAFRRFSEAFEQRADKVYRRQDRLRPA